MEDQFNVGEVTRVDVNEVKLRLAQAQLECGEITEANFCSQAVPLARSVYEGVVEEYRVGQRTAGDLADAAARLDTFLRRCR